MSRIERFKKWEVLLKKYKRGRISTDTFFSKTEDLYFGEVPEDY